MIFQRKVFMLLLASFQWTRCNAAENSDTTMTAATSVTSVVTSPTITLSSATSTVTDHSNQSNSMTSLYTTLSQTTQRQEFSTQDTTQSFTNESVVPLSSEIPTTTSSLTVSESYANTTYNKESEAAPSSFSATTDDVSFTMTASTDSIQTNVVTATPNNTTSAKLLTTDNSVKTTLTTQVQTISLQPSSTNISAQGHEALKENHINGGVIFGAIVGAVLGSALIGLVGYFICRKRKSEGFVHQRLYDAPTNDPVLRLDNVPASYGSSSADQSYYNPTMANETKAQNSNTPYDAIPMDDMTLSPHLP